MKRARLLLVGIALFSLDLSGLGNGNDPSDTLQIKRLSEKSANQSDPVGFTNLFENTASNGTKLNARAVSFVKDYMEKEGESMEQMRSWGKPYFTMIDGILVKYGLPKELKYLAVIESKLKPKAVSWAGAVGPWQLMPETARILGLKVNQKVDERTNYTKSTHAAAKYLRDLYDEFGDWLLVIAAYNGGSGNVYRAMKKSGSHNFWALQAYLPAESRNHVKKFIATHYIFEGQGSVTTLTKKEMMEQLGASAGLLRLISDAEMSNSESVKVTGKYYASVIAKHVLMDVDEFNRYNPEFDRLMANNSVYEMKLPSEKMNLFVANKYQILNESVALFASNDDETIPKIAANK